MFRVRVRVRARVIDFETVRVPDFDATRVRV